MLQAQCLFNYACLQVHVNNNAYIENLFVQVCNLGYFEVEDVKTRVCV